ncbi:hypothetical protein M0R45_004067 [Rubus argutus]|uniref:Aldehyde dehydrogenase domain-containing protein n=1 Tax=Rubus argutus TaxID=59490 RepID=A0AAW1YII8_RUBAR
MHWNRLYAREEKLAPTVIELLKKTIKRFYTENPKDAKCSQSQNLFIEPIILLDPPLDAAIMTEEIFGPLLPIITLKNIQESIEFINARPKPLTIYAFTKDESFKKKILSETSSGSVTFNDVLIQFLCDGLPFGGVGQSGFGRLAYNLDYFGLLLLLVGLKRY